MTKPKNTATFAYTNTHPKGIKTHSDCVYRAISIATGKTWLEVYDELTKLGRELLAPPNDKLTYTTYLDRIADRLEIKISPRRPTGVDVAKMKITKVYVVRMANHLAVVKDGKIRDTWDCSNKAAYIIWVIR